MGNADGSVVGIGVLLTYDPEKETLAAPGCVLRNFDKVRVKISVDSSRPHRPKLMLNIIEPALPT